jgi:ribonuclease HI
MVKYYAVVSGVVPGIYTDWPTVQRMTRGYSGAIYKSFRTREEAEAFMRTSTFTSSSISTNNKTIIYTDGSYQDNICGFGVTIAATNGDKFVAYGRVPLTDSSNNVAELYAIYTALSLVQDDTVLYSDSQYAVACLTTYIHNWMKNGWSGVANRTLIEGIYSQMIGRDVTLQHIMREFNAEADALADKGRIGTENLIIFKNGVRIN